MKEELSKNLIGGLLNVFGVNSQGKDQIISALDKNKSENHIFAEALPDSFRALKKIRSFLNE